MHHHIILLSLFKKKHLSAKLTLTIEFFRTLYLCAILSTNLVNMECVLCFNLLTEPAEPNSPTFAKRPKTPDLPAEDPADKKLCALICGHIFHEKCVISLYEYKNGFPECPVCRKSYALRDMRIICLPDSPTVDQVDKLVKENRELKRQLACLLNESPTEPEGDKMSEEMTTEDNANVKEPDLDNSTSSENSWLSKSDFY